MMAAVINVVIFDILGVLFYIDKVKALQLLSYKDAFVYFCQKRRNPIDECLSILDRMRQEVPGQFQQIVPYKGTFLPNCIVQWQQGLISEPELFEQIKSYLALLDKEHYFSTACHRRVIYTLLDVMLNSRIGLEVYRLIPSTAQLIKTLKQQGMYKLYILSNIDKQTFEGLKQRYSPIFDCFDGMVTSCYSHFIKPEASIFECLIQKYNLDPHHCCLVDDQIENLEMAKKLGMDVVYCKKPAELYQLFEQKGLL